MDNFIAFFNSFINYLFLMFIIVVVAALGFVIGRIASKIKEKNKAESVVTASEASEK